MINKPPPFKGLHVRIPIIIPNKGRGLKNHGSGLPGMGLSLLGLGFRDLGCRDLGLRGLGFRDLGFKVEGVGFRATVLGQQKGCFEAIIPGLLQRGYTLNPKPLNPKPIYGHAPAGSPPPSPPMVWWSLSSKL